MQTLLQIIAKAGGWRPSLYLKIANAPYMELVIEAIDESGPLGLPSLSVCHYGEQNGDLMRDPEMCFELGFAAEAHLDPFYWRNDYVAVEQWSRNIIREHYVCLLELHEQHKRFAETWDNNLRYRDSPKPSRTSAFSASSLSAGADSTRCVPLRDLH